MAIWQFQCNIIPARVNIDRLSRNEIISWKGETQPSHEVTFLEQEKVGQKTLYSMGSQVKRV